MDCIAASLKKVPHNEGRTGPLKGAGIANLLEQKNHQQCGDSKMNALDHFQPWLTLQFRPQLCRDCNLWAHFASAVMVRIA